MPFPYSSFTALSTSDGATDPNLSAALSGIRRPQWLRVGAVDRCPDQDVAEAGAAELLCATAAAVKRGYGLGVREFSSIKWQCVGPSACETVT